MHSMHLDKELQAHFRPDRPNSIIEHRERKSKSECKHAKGPWGEDIIMRRKEKSRNYPGHSAGGKNEQFANRSIDTYSNPSRSLSIEPGVLRREGDANATSESYHKPHLQHSQKPSLQFRGPLAALHGGWSGLSELARGEAKRVRKRLRNNED